MIRAHVGKLLWLALCTRPDIHQTVSRLAATINLRSDAVRDVILRIWYYLNQTKNYGIHYTKKGILDREGLTVPDKEWEYEEKNLTIFTDADHMGCPFTLRSTGGFCVYLFKNLIGFTSTKQKCNATSSTVAEVLAILDAVKETVWLSNLMRNIDISWGETLLYCDSQPAINQCKHPTTHKNTRHYENKLCWIRENIAKEKIQINYIPTELNIADIFTKPLHFDTYEKHTKQLLERK